MSEITNDTTLEEFKDKLKDRFGPLPNETKELLETVRLKRIASKIGIERIVLKKGKCLCYFIADQKNKFYSSENFGYLLNQIKKESGNPVLFVIFIVYSERLYIIILIGIGQ